MLVDPASVGADMVRVDRGGDVTFHGPGQLVGYPLVTVGDGPHRGRAHVHRSSRCSSTRWSLLGLASDGSRPAGRLSGRVGRARRRAGAPGPRKIGAIGVRTSRGRSTHGFALNVRTDLSMFDHIVPCGIADKPVTSLEAEGYEATMAQVVEAVIAAARSAGVSRGHPTGHRRGRAGLVGLPGAPSQRRWGHVPGAAGMGRSRARPVAVALGPSRPSTARSNVAYAGRVSIHRRHWR